MPTTTGAVAAHRALASDSRQALLDALRRRRLPICAGEAGEAVGLHRNTARVHLEVLAAAGLVTRSVDSPRGRGRPRVLYSPERRSTIASGGEPGGASYRDLARLLANQLAVSPDATLEAVRAGGRWAAALETEPVPGRPLSRSEAVAAATEILDELGFEPVATPPINSDRILLRRCPFDELAREQRRVICNVHLGMLQAAFEHFDTSLVVAGLDSFAEDDPLLCVVRLADKTALPLGLPRRRSRRSA